MPIQRSQRVSIVIPVYNEAEFLGACLDAIASQTCRPHEVIVVDNNSTDGSSQIAARYDFVTVIRESRQGVVFARSAGFDAATGDIIGRIDGDTVIPCDWVETVIIQMHNSTAAAISGSIQYDDISLKGLIDGGDAFFRSRIARKLARHRAVFLQAANMAMRADVWRKVREDVCYEGSIHEDFDLAIHLQRHGYQVAFDPSLSATISIRRVDMSFRSFARYAWRSPQTYIAHGLPHGKYMYPAIITVLVCYPAGRMLFKGYDPELGKFSFMKLIGNYRTVQRVDPTVIDF